MTTQTTTNTCRPLRRVVPVAIFASLLAATVLLGGSESAAPSSEATPEALAGLNVNSLSPRHLIVNPTKTNRRELRRHRRVC